MATSADIDGVPCTLERLPDGSIRVSHESSAINAMHATGTGGEVWYIVHPAQRHQYEHLESLLPPAERSAAATSSSDARPWWSYTGAQRERDRDEAGE